MLSIPAFIRPLSFVSICLVGLNCQAQSLSDVVGRALAVYPSVLAAQAKVDSARSDIGRARSQHYPQFSLGAGLNDYSSGQMPDGMGRSTFSPSAKVNLWAGGRIEAEAERAEALTESSEFQRRLSLDDVALQATEAYLNWSRVWDLHELAVRNFQAHSDILDDLRKIALVDTGRRIDLEQAQVRVDSANLMVQTRNAELLQAMQKLRRFWDGSLSERPADIQAMMLPGGALADLPQDMTSALDLMSDDSASVAQSKAQVLAAEAAVRQASALYWPTVDLVSSRAFNSLTQRFETLTQVQLNMQVFNGHATSAQVEGAVAQLRAAQANLDEARLLARDKVALAWQEWMSASVRSALGQSQSDVGDKVAQGYRQQFRLARRSLLDLLNIQNEAFNYRSAARAAFHDERVARARLLAAMGELASRFDTGAVAAAGH